MADLVATIKVMPENPEVNLEDLEKRVKEKINGFTKEEAQMKVMVEPVAFGLKSLNVTFVMDESLGSLDPLEEEISKFEDVASVEVTDVSRALG